MLGLTLALAVAAAMLAPHLLPLQRATAPAGIAVWSQALLLRAVVALGLAILALVHIARLWLVQTPLDACWHELVPDLPTMLGFGEHPVSHAIVAVPLLVLGLSVLAHGAILVRDWVVLRRRLAHARQGGPLGSMILPDERAFLAVTQLGRGRILVSERAVAALDDEELAAGLEHERAHLRRGHRPLLLLCALLAAIARPLPGTSAALDQLRFQLERDADATAVRRLRTPLPLASAICKVATDAPPAATAPLGGRGTVVLRVQELVGDAPPRSAAVERAARLLALALAALAIGLVTTGPAWSFGAPAHERSHPCSHH